MDHLTYIRDLLKEDCHLSDKEIAQKLCQRFNMEKPLHSTSILRYRHKIMPEMGLEKWTVQMVSKRGENCNTPQQMQERKEVMNKLLYYRKHDALLVFTGETYFVFRRNWGTGKAPDGKKQYKLCAQSNIFFSDHFLIQCCCNMTNETLAGISTDT